MNKRLHPLLEQEGEIGAESVSVETPVETGSTETASVQETVNETPESSAESESSFARRLREHSEKVLKSEREKWEQETGEKYKDYDTHKELSDYFQKINGTDAMTLKERIELEKLQDRAEEAQVPVDVLKRIDFLEAKAAKADELEQKQQVEQTTNQYFSTLEKFVSDKGVSKDELNQFMIDNKLTYDLENMERSFTVALKAFKADQYEAEKAQFEAGREQLKKDAVKEYLDSKKAPKAEGTGSAGFQSQGPPKSFADAEARALARIRSAQTTI